MRSMASLAQDEDIFILDAGERKSSITTARALNVFGRTFFFKEIKEQDKREKRVYGGDYGIDEAWNGNGLNTCIIRRNRMRRYFQQDIQTG
eukprot:3038514-Ditylum_brightwellii.AAC.1